MGLRFGSTLATQVQDRGEIECLVLAEVAVRERGKAMHAGTFVAANPQVLLWISRAEQLPRDLRKVLSTSAAQRETHLFRWCHGSHPNLPVPGFSSLFSFFLRGFLGVKRFLDGRNCCP